MNNKYFRIYSDETVEEINKPSTDDPLLTSRKNVDIKAMIQSRFNQRFKKAPINDRKKRRKNNFHNLNFFLSVASFNVDSLADSSTANHLPTYIKIENDDEPTSADSKELNLITGIAHMPLHSYQEDEKWKCEKCNKKLSNKRNLLMHIENRNCAKYKRYEGMKLKIISLQFNNCPYTALRSNDGKWKCKLCDRVLTTGKNLAYHMKNQFCINITSTIFGNYT